MKKGQKWSPEEREQMRAIWTPEKRAEHSRLMSGRTRSPEHCARLSESQKGKVITPEQRAKISATLKGRKLSDETRAKMSAARTGLKRTDETKARMSVAQRGEKHWNWKGGKTVMDSGYVMVYFPDHPAANCNRVLLHRVVMEQHIGRYLSPEEVVHHIDGNPLNNDIENLQLFPNVSEHVKHHRDKERGGGT